MSDNQKKIRLTVRIQKMDAAERIVYGEVYPPMVMDSHGEFMFPEDVRTLAHRFMQLDLKSAIDTNHDNKPNGSYPVESFVARDGDPDYTPGAWVMGVKVPDDETWTKVENRELNAFSWEAYVRAVDCEVEVETVRDRIGETEEADGHTHAFFLHVNHLGKITKGWTDEVNGHRHHMKGGCITDLVSGHSHRFFV